MPTGDIPAGWYVLDKSCIVTGSTTFDPNPWVNGASSGTGYITYDGGINVAGPVWTVPEPVLAPPSPCLKKTNLEWLDEELDRLRVKI